MVACYTKLVLWSEIWLLRSASSSSRMLSIQPDRRWLVAVRAQFYHRLELSEWSLAGIAIKAIAVVATFITLSDAVEVGRHCEFATHYSCTVIPAGV